MSDIEINLKTSDTASYYQYMQGVSPVKRLYIKSDELIEDVDICISSNPQFLIDYTLSSETLPRNSKISYESNVTLSPIYLVALSGVEDGEIIVTLSKKGKEIARTTAPIKVLGYDILSYDEDVRLLATRVKGSEAVNDTLASARRVLQDWKKKDDTLGYDHSSKNDVRFLMAAIYKVMLDKSFIKGESENDLRIVPHDELIKNTTIDSLSLALFMASVLESAGLNAVISKADGKWLVGVWLKEECFPDIVIEAGELLSKRMAVGVNDFTCISVDDIFNRIAFEGSEKRCQALLKSNFDFAVDIKRARIGRIYPLPTRVKRASGYDLIDDNIYNIEEVPHDIKEYDKDLSIDSNMTKEKQWERRLLDLSMRNALLNFKENRNQVKIIFSSIYDFVTRFDENKEYSVLPRVKGVDAIAPFVEKLTLAPTIDLLNIEMNNAKLHANVDGDDFEKAMNNVYRKDKLFLEESGTNSLYLEVGFLKYIIEGEKDFKFAPIFLYPVKLTKKMGNKDSYTIRLVEDEVRINSTLLEYLFQEFSLDLRGLMNMEHLDSDTILSIIGRIRREIVDRTSWDITEDIFLGNVSFANYLMWNDVKTRIDDFKSSKIIAGFIDNNKRVFNKEDYELTDRNTDETYREDGIYLPLSADSSQYSAIVDSLDKSFVLHGPPGTGKSQTITNIIANNILKGRRVLFVAEKMAALSVVEKRLKDIGLGDFCLELHSNKNNKIDVVNFLEHTMNLPAHEDVSDYGKKADEIRSLISSIDESMLALHKTRRLGVSIYEGAMRYLENIDASNALKIDPIFYERLTGESLKNYEDILTELVLEGKECGEIVSSPFRYVGDVNYDATFKQKGEEIIDILTMEINHIRDYSKKFMDTISLRLATITNERLRAMYNICMLISGNSAIKAYFRNKDKYDSAYGIIKSYDSNKLKYKEVKAECLKIYSEIPDDLPKELLVDSTDKKLSKAVKKTRKQMSRYLISTDENAEDTGINLLIRLFTIERNIENIKKDIDILFDSEGVFDENVRAINLLYDSGKILYPDFKEENFEGIIASILDGKFIVKHFALQYEMYSKSYKAFKKLFDYKLSDDKIDIMDIASFAKHLKNNLDLMPSWCKYNALLRECKDMGLEFVVDLVKSGNIKLDDVIRCFRKSVYGNFVESELSLDKTLSQFSGKSIEEKMDKLRLLSDNYELLTRQEMYYRMVSRIPHSDEEGPHNIEMVMLSRACKSGMKGTTLRKLFLDIPTIMKYACPCMLMSPVSVAQYLDMDLDKFDLVVFDEASQMPTAEAIGAIARAKNVIVVGDPKQLPPTKFFTSEYKDEENQCFEDLESILDDCLALGMPERHLLWHYRSQDESLIAFSNAMYYDNRLLTFPSPMELDSKVKLRYVDGIYERGGSKRNAKEAEALVDEVIARLTDGKHMSIGIVTFNTAQQNYIDDLLHTAIKKNNLFSEAYECEEPIFVKNLENVQGDERDIILFSVGYGPDSNGKLSLNFGPINQEGGYRRLNVAITRARAEMIVFSSITGNMINLSKTDNKGVKGLKAFLEYAERGRDMLILDSKSVEKHKSKGIGAYIAEDLKEKGFDCEYDVGVSNFKIDVAVVDPKDKNKYILAIMCDGDNAKNIGSVHDRMTMNGKILKKLGWNVYYLWTINYLNNSKREIQKIRDFLMTFTRSKAPSKKTIKETIAKYKKNYRAFNAKPLAKGSQDYILDEKNESVILDKLMEIIALESPIEENILLDRLTTMYNITRSNKKAITRLLSLARTVSSQDNYMDKTFYIIDKGEDKFVFRPIDDNKGRREIDEVHPNEIIAVMHCILECNIKLSHDDLMKETLELIGYNRKTKIAPIWIDLALDKAIEEGTLILAPNDMITM